MTSTVPAQCLSCVHLVRKKGLGLAPVEVCAAYPRGIPGDIQRGADHRDPRGDETDGLIFELAEDHEDLFGAWESTFLASPANRITMDYPVTFTRPPDAML